MKGQESHPDSEVLAEYRAGLITGRRGVRIAAHLASCDRCAALSGQLAEISVLLAAAPAPTMPDSVARRLDTVLAAEAAKRHDSERAGAGAPRHRARRPRRARSDRFRFVAVRVLAPVAAVVALVAVGYSLTHLSGPTTSSAASSAAGSASAPVPSAHAAPANSQNENRAAAPAFASPGAYNVHISPTLYQRSTLRKQVEAELRAPKGPAEPPSTQIQGCVSRVTRDSSLGIPRLVEKARFQGQPAIVIVAFRGGSGTVWVTAPGCSATGDTVLYQLPGISAP